MELMAENRGKIYDLSGLCKEISWSDALNEGASTLEFSYISDGLNLQTGDIIRLTDAGQSKGIFFGTVFVVSGDETGIVKAKAYDQLRYAKAKDLVVLENGTLKTLVERMCSFLSLQTGSMQDSGFVLDTIAAYDKTWLDHITQAISDTLIGTQEMYCLRDEFGKVCLWNMQNLQLPLVLGDRSLVTGYSWEKSIDDDFYNRIKVVWKDETAGRVDIGTAVDTASVNRLGILQYVESSKSGIDNDAKAKERAENLLKLYNHEKETMKLTCLGDLRVRAGNSFYGSISDINLNRRLIVQKVSHDFLPAHTMEIEVMLGG